MNEQALHKLVTNFVSDLQSVFQKAAIAALNGNGSKIKLNGNGAHGGKRSPEDLERLSTMFVAYVGKNPGRRIEQINKELGTTTKDLALPIRKLIADRQVKAKGKKRSTAYFPGGASKVP